MIMERIKPYVNENSNVLDCFAITTDDYINVYIATVNPNKLDTKSLQMFAKDLNMGVLFKSVPLTTLNLIREQVVHQM